MKPGELKSIQGSPYYYEPKLDARLSELEKKVSQLRASGALTPAVLKGLRNYFRIKDIYNSNAIEGNLLDYNETRLVIEKGMTITGKPLKDTLEAKNLSHALTLFEELADKSSGPILETDIRSLSAAILKGVNDQEAGKYRQVEVMITGSPHKPARPEAVGPDMQKFGEWLKNVDQDNHDVKPICDPILAACAAHSWLVYVHPFIDGNGRVARLLLNLVLMRYGYPIAIITREDRQRYYEALRQSDDGDLSSVIALVLESVEESLEEYLAAAKEQQDLLEWKKEIVSRFNEKEQIVAQNEYQVWASAMELLKSQFKQICDLLNPEDKFGTVHFGYKDYGSLEFEKFLSLRQHRAAKKTWAFGIQLRSGTRQRRYLFWYGFASMTMSNKLGPNQVAVHISFADDEFQYEKIDDSDKKNLPDLCEIGYSPEKEKFFWRGHAKRTSEGRIEVMAKKFFEEVAQKQL